MFPESWHTEPAVRSSGECKAMGVGRERGVLHVCVCVIVPPQRGCVEQAGQTPSSQNAWVMVLAWKSGSVADGHSMALSSMVLCK